MRCNKTKNGRCFTYVMIELNENQWTGVFDIKHDSVWMNRRCVQFKCTSRVKPEIGSMQSLRIYPRTRRVPAWVIRGKRDRRWRKRDKLIESSKMLLKYLLNDKTSSLLAEKIHDTRRIKPIWLVRLHSNIDYCSRSLSCLSLSLCCLEQFTLSLIQDEKVPLKIHDFGCWRLSNWCDSLNPSSE